MLDPKTLRLVLDPLLDPQAVQPLRGSKLRSKPELVGESDRLSLVRASSEGVA